MLPSLVAAPLFQRRVHQTTALSGVKRCEIQGDIISLGQLDDTDDEKDRCEGGEIGHYWYLLLLGLC